MATDDAQPASCRDRTSAVRNSATPATSTYTRLIKRLAPQANPADIEALLRQEHGTLENIEPIHFARAVKAAATRIPAHHETSASAA